MMHAHATHFMIALVCAAVCYMPALTGQTASQVKPVQIYISDIDTYLHMALSAITITASSTYSSRLSLPTRNTENAAAV